MGDECESTNQNSSLKKRAYKFVNETPPSLLMMMNNKHQRTELQLLDDVDAIGTFEPSNATVPRISTSQHPSTTTTTTTQPQPQPSYVMRVNIELNNNNNNNNNHSNHNNENDNDDDNDEDNDNQSNSESTNETNTISPSSSSSHSPSSTSTTPSNSQIPITATTTTTTTSSTTPFTISIPAFTPPNPSEVIEINDNNEGTRSTPLVIDLTEEDTVTTPLQNSISDTLSSTTTTSSSSSILTPFGTTTRIPITSIPILSNELLNSSLGNLTTILSYISRLSRSNSSVKSPKPSEVVVINEDNDENKKPPANVEIQEEKKKEPALEENILSKLTCSICLENVKAPTATTCGHIYCQKCIESATKKFKFCPLCKKKCTMSSLIKLYS